MHCASGRKGDGGLRLIGIPLSFADISCSRFFCCASALTHTYTRIDITPPTSDTVLFLSTSARFADPMFPAYMSPYYSQVRTPKPSYCWCCVNSLISRIKLDIRPQHSHTTVCCGTEWIGSPLPRAAASPCVSSPRVTFHGRQSNPIDLLAPQNNLQCAALFCLYIYFPCTVLGY